ncbi:HYR domain-containing protein, partial [Flavobacterium aquidurense]|uniref:HYR domain-containing protein n=1 Tax=Flavobacterium aquidurense TaxID=362413 RepID=UPI00285E4837
GNTATAVQKVTINDTAAPTITAPANVTASTDSGCSAASVVLGTPATDDNCGVATVTNDAPVSFPLGDTNVTWTVTDNSGNTATAVQKVTINDTAAPTITAPANVTASTDSGCSATSVVLGTPTTADNCGVATVTNNAPVSFPLGDTNVTWTVTDNSGNTATAVQKVTIKDTALPTITAPANVTASTDSGCSATSVVLGTAVTDDNCGVATVTNNAPVSFPLGDTDVTWTVTDNSGNIATAVQKVTINDTALPTITAPADVTVTINPQDVTATVNLETPTAADNCGIASVTNDAPVSFPLGDTIVTWTVTDNSGNTAKAIQMIRINKQSSLTATMTQTNVYCYGEANGSASVLTTGGTGPYSYSWNTGETTATIENLTVGTYHVTVMDTKGLKTTADVTITQPEILSAQIIVDDESCSGCKNAFANVVAAGGTLPYTYSWSTGATTASVNNLAEGIYNVGVMDANGCMVISEITITKPTKDDGLKIFNALTPNGDGINDEFIIKGIEYYPNNTLEIYNRWGVKVYETEKYGQNGNYFRGISEGRVTLKQDDGLPTGTYFYILRYSDVEGKVREKSGYLYLTK